jgi:hypothetical protein
MPRCFATESKKDFGEGDELPEAAMAAPLATATARAAAATTRAFLVLNLCIRGMEADLPKRALRNT